jgi:LPXTG-motif cell wall-anchored protein
VERNDTPADYFPISLAAPRVELSLDGGATTFSTLTALTPSTTGDNGDGTLGVAETWTWTVTTNPTEDTTITATAFGSGPRGRVISFLDDPDERASAFVDVFTASTVVGIGASPTQAPAGGQTTWTITERNDGDAVLTSPLVHLDADGGDDGDVATLSAPPASGDADGDGALDPSEVWSWTTPMVVAGDVTVTATGHGIDPLGRDITYPADPDERASASATAGPLATLPATGAPSRTTPIAVAGLVLLVIGAGSLLVSRARSRRV